MRRIIYIITSTYLGLASILIGLSPALVPHAMAAAAPAAPNPNVGQALEIAPPVINLTADPGQTISANIFLRNVSTATLVVNGTANDFVAAGEDGTPKVILNDDTNNPYSLKSWVNPPASLQLVPKEIKSMKITINVPANASPGGHYGIIRFTATAPNLNGQGVAISASLGALILMTVNGNVTEKLSVKDFTVSHNNRTGKLFESGPLNFVTRLTNTGNVHEQPVGQIIIKDMFGKRLASVNVNLPPKNVLPQSTRKFESPLDKSVIGNKRLFGHYTATLTVTYGKNKQTVTSSLSFWVIPIKTVVIIIALLVAGFFAVRYGLKRYNRYIIGKSGKARH
jgi:hypothetical protein